MAEQNKESEVSGESRQASKQGGGGEKLTKREGKEGEGDKRGTYEKGEIRRKEEGEQREESGELGKIELGDERQEIDERHPLHLTDYGSLEMSHEHTANIDASCV